MVLRNLQHFGGRVHLVNANYREVAGLACHSSLPALPEAVVIVQSTITVTGPNGRPTRTMAMVKSDV